MPAQLTRMEIWMLSVVVILEIREPTEDLSPRSAV